MIPLIGITTKRIDPDSPMPTHAVSEAYVHAILRAGGTPVMIPSSLPIDQLINHVSHLDGILFTGGGDIHPALFNGNPHPSVYDVDQQRDELEIALIKAVITAGIPFLCICRGIQVFNIALGGTLYTDIADQLPGALRHDWFPGHPRDLMAHKITVEKHSRLFSILKTNSTSVNSLHHQGIHIPAEGLRISATSPDGLIEAVEISDHPYALGVQWHPEWLINSEPMQGLFSSLVHAASE